MIRSVFVTPFEQEEPGRTHEDKVFIPRRASDVSPGDIVAGVVCRVEAFGVFVKFLENFMALCPRSMVGKRADPKDLFHVGDSVRYAVYVAPSALEYVIV